ncbi:hypothetical protein [Mycobacterium szulgai]|uniref:Uncharacterized protein n=1 Tax=Mycobacterium szulgai TaxID=1787 RepID=A0A1X2EIS6_MYCSZ|nr:hypothetical protein [Mycobacterium szulgai]MCV7077987.1 hypothetical protein [Mycobacterium szulgai]ORX03354.1 hypothetical protein AWC27_28040 [Mycobacterium szulgai]
MTFWEGARPVAGRSLAREVVLPVLAVVAIVGYADIRIPMGLPGHRGLVWLTLLVAVVLATGRRATVVAVGTVATIATFAMHAGTGTAVGDLRYVAAGILLCAVAGVRLARRRRWVIVLAAAPIHLVALIGSVAAISPALAEKALFHLGFGLVAGLLGWAIASAAGRAP